VRITNMPGGGASRPYYIWPPSDGLQIFSATCPLILAPLAQSGPRSTLTSSSTSRATSERGAVVGGKITDQSFQEC